VGKGETGTLTSLDKIVRERAPGKCHFLQKPKRKRDLGRGERRAHLKGTVFAKLVRKFLGWKGKIRRA